MVGRSRKDRTKSTAVGNGRGRRRPEPVTREEFLKAIRMLHKEFVGLHGENLAMGRKLDEAMDRVDGAVNAINLAAGGLQNRAGRNLEETLAGVFRYALGHKDIRPESIRLRQKITADGKQFEADLMMHDGKTYLFEVTFYVDEDKVTQFEERARAVGKHLGLREDMVEKILISLDKSFEALSASRNHNILLVP